jgi:hypothetical protein
MAELPKYRFAIVPASAAAAIASVPVRLIKVVLFGGSADSQVEFKNAATDTGDVLLTLAALLDTSFTVSMADVGGLAFSTACFCKPAGTGAIAYVWWEPMQTQVAHP